MKAHLEIYEKWTGRSVCTIPLHRTDQRYVDRVTAEVMENFDTERYYLAEYGRTAVLGMAAPAWRHEIEEQA